MGYEKYVKELRFFYLLIILKEPDTSQKNLINFTSFSKIEVGEIGKRTPFYIYIFIYLFLLQ